jgi:uncharacterized membrane protein YtjA (UPF0391 family)
MAQMCTLLAFLLVWQLNCELFFVCSESRHSGCSLQFNFLGELLVLVRCCAVLVVLLLAVVLGFAHVDMASIGIATVLFLLFLVAVLGHAFRRP